MLAGVAIVGECPIVGDGFALEVDQRSQDVGQIIGEEDRWQKQ